MEWTTTNQSNNILQGNLSNGVQLRFPSAQKGQVWHLQSIQGNTSANFCSKCTTGNTCSSAKLATTEERDADCNDTSPEHATICFNLRNVISLPRSSTSSFFYHCKLTIYNLTGHYSSVTDRRGYCAIWYEGQSNIASSLIILLRNISADHPQVTRLTMVWFLHSTKQEAYSISWNSRARLVQLYRSLAHQGIQQYRKLTIYSQTEKKQTMNHSEV